MDADRISENLKYLAAASSTTLNIDERMNLDLALAQLSSSVKFESFELWGKINGKQAKQRVELMLFVTPFHFRNRRRLLHRCWHKLHWTHRLPTAQIFLVHLAELSVQRTVSAEEQFEKCLRAVISSLPRSAFSRCCKCRWNLRVRKTQERLFQSGWLQRPANNRTRPFELHSPSNRRLVHCGSSRII